jgi:hypothetical protein
MRIISGRSTMKLPDRHLLRGPALGAISVAALLAATLAAAIPALGSDTATAGIDPSRLVKFEERDYVVDYEDWVATDPLSTTQVKKIEAGKVSYVTITTTATGTYSTDGMFSNHIQYPGISVAPAGPATNFFHYWSNGLWTGFSTGNAGSFYYYSARHH